jgi:hypothetical protein
MPRPGSALDAAPDPLDRLNGWKEVASFLGKGVRTVQRWERELGLPVHRLGKDGGEIVFALKTEVQHWTLTQRPSNANGVDDQSRPRTQGTPSNGASGAEVPQAEPDSAQPDSPSPPASARWFRTPAAAAIAGLLVCLVAVAAWRVSRSSSLPVVEGAPPQPASFSVEDDTLRILDARDAVIWKRRFPEGLNEASYVGGTLRDARAAIEDFDGDGQREVAFIADSPEFATPVLSVFDADGTVRFTHRPDATVHYGSSAYSPHWRAYRLAITRAPAGTPLLWLVSIHDHEFPTLLEQIDAAGRTVSEYWSNGYIDFVGSATWHGRPVVLVGATNNEHRGASLAVFEGAVTGSAPATNDGYRCRDCPPGRPSEFLVLPRTCMARYLEGQAWTQRVRAVAGDRIVALVGHGRASVNGLTQPADAYYTFGPDLRPEGIDISREFLLVHEELRRLGHLDHAFGPQDEADLQPLLRWDGTRFVPLPAAPVRK